jgi:hypothetical protein
MQMLSDDDLDLHGMSDEELEAAWDLWFDLAQETNDFDPPYSHGVFVLCGEDRPADPTGEPVAAPPASRHS